MGFMLHIDCSSTQIGTFHLLCNVLPPERRVAAMSDKPVARGNFLQDQTAAKIRLIVCVFPIPPLASRAKNCHVSVLQTKVQRHILLSVDHSAVDILD